MGFLCPIMRCKVTDFCWKKQIFDNESLRYLSKNAVKSKKTEKNFAILTFFINFAREFLN